MALPIISTPEFFITIPSTGKEIKYRPFLVKEEKMLYIAMEGGDERDVANAVLKVLQDCILTNDIDVNKLPAFDIEYLFLNLRAKSVGEVINLRLRHSDGVNCNFIHETEVNIEDIKVDGEVGDGKIMLTDVVGVKMRYPSISVATKLQSAHKMTDTEKAFDLIARCVEYVFDENEVYDSASHKEVVEFIEGLSKSQFELLTQFFKSSPKLKHSFSWKCPQCGHVENVVLEGLQSFFK
jgi:hypothetical protein